MIVCVRTTLNLPDALMERLRAHARESGRTVTSVVEEALRDALEQRHGVAEPVDFPVLGDPGGTPLADLADAHHVLNVMDGAGAGSIERLLADIRRIREVDTSARPAGDEGR